MVSGCDRAGYEMSVGPHGSGTDTGSENSLLILDFARSQKLRISGSWYQRPDPHRWTWYSDVGNAAKEIDHILVSTRWRILQNCRVYRSAVVLTMYRLWLPPGPLQNFTSGQ